LLIVRFAVGRHRRLRELFSATPGFPQRDPGNAIYAMRGFPLGRYSEFTPLRTVDAAGTGGNVERGHNALSRKRFSGALFDLVALQYKQTG